MLGLYRAVRRIGACVLVALLFVPDAPYALVAIDGPGQFRQVGTILYKDIPPGAWISAPPPGVCGWILKDDHVTGGAWSDYDSAWRDKFGRK